MNYQCHLLLLLEDGWESSICRSDVTRRPVPLAESQSHISLFVLSHLVVGEDVYHRHLYSSFSFQNIF